MLYLFQVGKWEQIYLGKKQGLETAGITKFKALQVLLEILLPRTMTFDLLDVFWQSKVNLRLKLRIPFSRTGNNTGIMVSIL